MKHRSTTTPLRLVLQTLLSLLFIFTCVTGLLVAAASLPLYQVVTCIVGLIVVLVVWGILYDHKMTYGIPIWSKPTLMEDRVFGRIRYVPNRKRPSLSHWYCVEPPSYANRLDEVEDFIIFADEHGPTERQHRLFRDLLDKFDILAIQIADFLNADYLKWCDFVREDVGHNGLEEVPDFPLLADSRDVYESVSFCKLEVTSEAHERGPNCEVYLTIGISWEEDHDRQIFIKESRMCDWAGD